jgi:hypothetical protein
MMPSKAEIKYLGRVEISGGVRIPIDEEKSPG